MPTLMNQRLQNHQGPPASFKLRFLSHFNSTFLPHFNNMVESELVTMKFSTAKASSAVQVQIRTSLGLIKYSGSGGQRRKGVTKLSRADVNWDVTVNIYDVAATCGL